MFLSKYISDLLYKHGCVIIPDFGGFVTNNFPSGKDVMHKKINPPGKSIAFNENLSMNDGLLINHISKSLNIPFDEAHKFVRETVEQWKEKLKTGFISLKGIGSLSMKERKKFFEPSTKINYLDTSFGLKPVSYQLILRKEHYKKNKVKLYKKYLVTAVFIGLAIVVSVSYLFNWKKYQELLNQEYLTAQIEKASFNILEPLPGINLNLKKKVKYRYYIIAGAFREKKNAFRKLNSLHKKGFKSHIVGLNKWGLIQVSYSPFFSSIRKAKLALKKIHKIHNKPAWLYIDKS